MKAGMLFFAILLSLAGYTQSQDCIQGAPGGGSYMYSAISGTGTKCATWSTLVCGEAQFEMSGAGVMDTVLLLIEGDTVIAPLAIGSGTTNIFPEVGASVPLSTLPSSLRGGVIITVSPDGEPTVFRETGAADWVKIRVLTEELKTVETTIFSNLKSGTEWSAKIPQYVNPNLGRQTEHLVLCLGEEITWHSYASANDKIWETPSGLQAGDSVLIDEPGLYTWSTSCGAGDSIIVKQFHEERFALLAEAIPCSDSAIISLNSLPLGANVEWSTGATTSQIQVREGHYTATVHSSTGNCSVTLDTVVVFPATAIYIPDVFSPNYDGINDEFCVYTGPKVDLKGFEFKIFNRWGGEIFSTTDPAGCWDGYFKGQPCEIGSYSFVMQSGDCFRKGFFQLLR